jgi:hypothetical protein
MMKPEPSQPKHLAEPLEINDVKTTKSQWLLHLSPADKEFVTLHFLLPDIEETFRIFSNALCTQVGSPKEIEMKVGMVERMDLIWVSLSMRFMIWPFWQER